ncbi:hypothetical protein [Clostridia bacterium UC5.1-1D1]|uniref:hypothetical protein n=1 Tax=Agathobaculum massiliense TaxID=3014267 RepID=UPI0006C7B100
MKKNVHKLFAIMGSKKAYNHARRVYRAAVLTASVACFAVIPAFAADPLDAINSLSDFIFSIIKAVGLIIAGWGVVQFGMSVQSHDPSQRTQGILCVLGGLLIYFAKDVLDLITGG